MKSKREGITYKKMKMSKKDVKRQKELIVDSYKTFESIFSCKHVSEKVMIWVFATYTQSIFILFIYFFIYFLFIYLFNLFTVDYNSSNIY